MKEFMFVWIGTLILLLSLSVIYGWLHLPVFRKNAVTLFYAAGDGRELERMVRAYGWLRGTGLSDGVLVIVDCGLHREGLTTAQLLQERKAWVSYCPRQTLGDYLELLEDKI